MSATPTINATRLLARLDELGRIGASPGAGRTRLAASAEDGAARDLVVTWMRELGLEVTIDRIGNINGIWGDADSAPVIAGSHLDTVRQAGHLDGSYGVLAGLEVIETLQEAGVQPARPLAVTAFTNEEGVRFHPDMMGSFVVAGGMSAADALDARDQDGISLADALGEIGYAGAAEHLHPHAYVEIHIEQGPVLVGAGDRIGIVTELQGISQQEIRLTGEANHAGTTPMALRRDAGSAAGQVISEVDRIVGELGGAQLGTVGEISFSPGAINVIAGEARLTVDLRNTSDATLAQAEAMLSRFLEELSATTGVTHESVRLVRFGPVVFSAEVADVIEAEARAMGISWRRMASGAGHDAQMMARIAPAAMIFVPSEAGISHNPAEYTGAADLEAGANLLLRVMLELANKEFDKISDG